MSSIFWSSVATAAISAYPLAVFNRQTAGHALRACFQRPDARQIAAIIVRETSFLASLSISQPAGKAMKNTFGENKAVEYLSAFASGAVAGIVGHPADTYLTLCQNAVKIENVRQLTRGGGARACAVGFFNVCYMAVSNHLSPNS